MIKSAIYLLSLAILLTGCEQTAAPEKQISLAQHSVLSADLSDNGQLAMVAHAQQGVTVWDLAQQQPRWQWQHHNKDEPIILTRFANSAHYALTATAKTFAIWRTRDGQAQGYYALPTSSLRDATVSANGRYVLLGQQDGQAQWLDLQSGRRLAFLGHSEAINSVDMSANGRYALTAGDDYSAYFWDSQSGQVIWRFNHSQRVVMARLEQQGRYAFTADSKQGYLWDLKTGKQIATLQHDARFSVLSSARFAHDGQWLITGAPARQLALWQVSNGQRLGLWQVSSAANIKPASAVVYGVALGDNNHLLTVSSSGLAERWRIK